VSTVAPLSWAHYAIWLRKQEDHLRWSHALATMYTPVEGFDPAELIDA
jgi:hypothetical protein